MGKQAGSWHSCLDAEVAAVTLCRRCCRNPFLGEVLAGCLECLQLGGDEHAAPGDVV